MFFLICFLKGKIYYKMSCAKRFTNTKNQRITWVYLNFRRNSYEKGTWYCPLRIGLLPVF